MTCSDLWQSLPALGTAPHARFWVALEQNGSWGATALLQSDLDQAVGQALTDLVGPAGGQALLVRDPLDHAAGTTGHTVLLAGGSMDAPWLGRATLDDPSRLVDLLRDWLATGSDEMPSWLEPGEPVLLVCTNGKRDKCCAIKGRPVAVALAREFAGRVWESSHLHGHRFATTALCLPSSHLVARLDEPLGRALLAGDWSQLDADHDRGLTLLPQPLQVAESHVRSLVGGSVGPLTFVGPDADGQVTVGAATGQQWRLRITSRTLGLSLPKSCGKEAEPVVVWSVDDLT